MKTLRTILALLAALALVLSGPTAGAAAPKLEKDFARQIDASREPHYCGGPQATYGGVSMDPHYNACFILYGDILKITDARADGNAGVMKWRFYPERGNGQRGWRKVASRAGLCIYTGCSRPGFRSGVCDKNIPEHGILEYRAGMRVKSGSTSPKDMRFGQRYCLLLSGAEAINDGNCVARSAP